MPFEDVVACVGRDLPSDVIVTVDAGSFGAPVYRVIPFAPPQRLLAPISGAMGFGIPAAVAAALREPARRVVCFVGDGGLLMTGGELAVALERKLPLKMIVSENGSYGSILVQQERDYPGRAVGTMFTNPDLALFGRAFGFEVTRITAVSELDALPEFLQVGTAIRDSRDKPRSRAPREQGRGSGRRAHDPGVSADFSDKIMRKFKEKSGRRFELNASRSSA